MKLAVLIFSGVITLSCGGAYAQVQDSVGASPGPAMKAQAWEHSFSVSGAETFDFLHQPEKAQSFQFGGTGNGRWRMNLETVTRSEESPLPREEMRAGATYQFTPRFSLGGSLSVGAEELDDVSQWKEQSVEAGVRLKTTFKF